MILYNSPRKFQDLESLFNQFGMFSVVSRFSDILQNIIKGDLTCSKLIGTGYTISLALARAPVQNRKPISPGMSKFGREI